MRNKTIKLIITLFVLNLFAPKVLCVSRKHSLSKNPSKLSKKRKLLGLVINTDKKRIFKRDQIRDDLKNIVDKLDYHNNEFSFINNICLNMIFNPKINSAEKSNNFYMKVYKEEINQSLKYAQKIENMLKENSDAQLVFYNLNQLFEKSTQLDDIYLNYIAGMKQLCVIAIANNEVF